MKDVDVITFKTDHPISIPVPDRDLLELHGFGFMMQVLRLAGRMPWDHNKKSCASSVTNGRMAEKDHDLGYTQNQGMMLQHQCIQGRGYRLSR